MPALTAAPRTYLGNEARAKPIARDIAPIFSTSKALPFA
jgi:hypothetical protein